MGGIMALEALGYFLVHSLLASVYTLRWALALALDGGWVGHIKVRLVEYSRAVVEGASCDDANDNARLVCLQAEQSARSLHGFVPVAHDAGRGLGIQLFCPSRS